MRVQMSWTSTWGPWTFALGHSLLDRVLIVPLADVLGEARGVEAPARRERSHCASTLTGNNPIDGHRIGHVLSQAVRLLQADVLNLLNSSGPPGSVNVLATTGFNSLQKKVLFGRNP